jgi:hypothetical protein
MGFFRIQYAKGFERMDNNVQNSSWETAISHPSPLTEQRTTSPCLKSTSLAAVSSIAVPGQVSMQTWHPHPDSFPVDLQRQLQLGHCGDAPVHKGQDEQSVVMISERFWSNTRRAYWNMVKRVWRKSPERARRVKVVFERRSVLF